MTYTHHGIDYRWRLSRADIDEVLHYTHWIPASRGITDRFFADRYPGGSLGTFVAIFREASIILRDHVGSPHGGRCHWRLRHLYFTDTATWSIEWDDSVTGDDGRYLWRKAQ